MASAPLVLKNKTTHKGDLGVQQVEDRSQIARLKWSEAGNGFRVDESHHIALAEVKSVMHLSSKDLHYKLIWFSWELCPQHPVNNGSERVNSERCTWMTELSNTQGWKDWVVVRCQGEWKRNLIFLFRSFPMISFCFLREENLSWFKSEGRDLLLKDTGGAYRIEKQGPRSLSSSGHWLTSEQQL